jgi:hypothetical protein
MFFAYKEMVDESNAHSLPDYLRHLKWIGSAERKILANQSKGFSLFTTKDEEFVHFAS